MSRDLNLDIRFRPAWAVLSTLLGGRQYPFRNDSRRHSAKPQALQEPTPREIRLVTHWKYTLYSLQLFLTRRLSHTITLPLRGHRQTVGSLLPADRAREVKSFLKPGYDLVLQGCYYYGR